MKRAKNWTFEPAEDLDESERADLLAEIEKAGKVRKKRKHAASKARGQKLKTVGSVTITPEMFPELERRLQEQRFKITGAIIGGDGAGEIEIARYLEKIVRYTAQNGHIVRDPPFDITYDDGKINETPEPTLCGLSADAPVPRGGCWKCAIRVPEGVLPGQIEMCESRGWLHELQKGRHAFLLDGAPRSKSTSKTAQDAMGRALQLVKLDTPASALAVSSLARYRSPKIATIRVGSTPAAELYRLGLIGPVGQDEATTLDMYQLTTEGQDLLEKWLDIAP